MSKRRYYRWSALVAFGACVLFGGCEAETEESSAAPSPAAVAAEPLPTQSNRPTTDPPETAPPVAPREAHEVAHATEPLDELNPPGETFLLDGKYRMPVVSAGREPVPSKLTERPDYVPPNDPESDALRRGYRLSPPNALPLQHGLGSADWLAEEILLAVTADSRESLLDLRITFEEFAAILWEEMPQSRPVTNIKAEDAWFFLARDCISAINGTLGEYAGTALTFERLSFTKGLTRFPNYNLFQGVQIHARDPRGTEVILDFAHTFIEKDGAWKVYIYKD